MESGFWTVVHDLVGRHQYYRGLEEKEDDEARADKDVTKTLSGAKTTSVVRFIVIPVPSRSSKV